jgi:EAL domain-containing protein (putative c-di-GMP-specific phosphodiesterase class I)
LDLIMKPKSRLYSLVKNWTKKPGLAVKELHQEQLYEVMLQPESRQLEVWANSQSLSFELVLSSKDLVTEFVTFTSLEQASKDAAIDLIKEGIRAASYWHSFLKPYPIMLAMKAQWLNDPDLMNGFQEVLLKCHLPVGLIYVGINDTAELKQASQLQEALVQLQRLGILFHLLNFTGRDEECQLMLNHRFTHIHLAGDLIRQAIPGSQCEKKLIALRALIHANDARSVAGPIKLMHEKSVAEKHMIDCYYGKHIMPQMTLHQVLKMGKTSKQQIAMRQLIKKQLQKE